MFIAAWLNVMMFAGSLKYVQIAIGMLAIGLGLMSIKEFFWFNQGPSLLVPKESKKKIIKKMRQAISPERGLIAAMIGVAILAIGVNIIELLCTLGLPVVYTGILNTYGYPALVNYFFLLVYVIFYMIDDFIIFMIIATTMSKTKITEKYGRLSKLISGILILALGLIMLINPNLLMIG